MSEYLILIHQDPEKIAMPQMWEQMGVEHQKFGENNAHSLRGGHALQPTSTATTIRSDENGGFTVTDGPFIETKEALGGYYLIEAADLDEAISIAKQVPMAHGGVEVRPILTFS